MMWQIIQFFVALNHIESNIIYGASNCTWLCWSHSYSIHLMSKLHMNFWFHSNECVCVNEHLSEWKCLPALPLEYKSTFLLHLKMSWTKTFYFISNNKRMYETWSVCSDFILLLLNVETYFIWHWDFNGCVSFVWWKLVNIGCYKREIYSFVFHARICWKIYWDWTKCSSLQS